MSYIRDTRSDEEVFRQLQREAEAQRDENAMAAEIRHHLTEKNGHPPLQVKTDAPLSLTGQWGGEKP
jgi:hypothetical protein